MLLKPLLGVAGEVVKGVVDTKKAKAEQKVTEIKAKTELLNKQIKGEIDYDLEAIKGSKDSWKDEAWTILFIIIISMCFIPPLQPYVERGFYALSITPSWFQYAMYGAIASSFGLRGMGKVLGKK
tara:strand:+ start:52 stop:426 length:375 start_codon:yes stop_codon:yes gene_type:complete